LFICLCFKSTCSLAAPCEGGKACEQQLNQQGETKEVKNMKNRKTLATAKAKETPSARPFVSPHPPESPPLHPLSSPHLHSLIQKIRAFSLTRQPKRATKPKKAKTTLQCSLM
jgi:hypothetical protein